MKKKLSVGNLLSILFFTLLISCQQSDNTAKTETNKDTTQTKKEEVKPTIDLKATQLAYILAGVEIKDKTGVEKLLEREDVKRHYEQFNKQWENLEKARLSKMRTWKDTELKDLNKEGNTLFYPFSGPDFVNAYEFFPDCDNYVMFGLEIAGNLPDLENLPNGYFDGVRAALAEIFQRNYFITSYMGGSLYGKGVLPVIELFMARTGNQIIKTQRVYLDKDGKPVPFALNERAYLDAKGTVKIATEKEKINTADEQKVISGLMIEFLNVKKTRTQKVYYFGTNVEDPAMKDKQNLLAFIKSFPNKVTFIKSASYLLHGGNFSIIRDLVLESSKGILQDDTGVRYDVLLKAGFEVQLYGKYARPIADFANYTIQPALADAFMTRKDIKPLNFTYGYHWNTENTSVLVCRKK
ncbi:MAG: hypothetical protein EAZ55_01220 [Cytophagales bacterium]|nr:MAG: hypothetical protein EAZ55_01220 [Cytophagales bacterium]